MGMNSTTTESRQQAVPAVHRRPRTLLVAGGLLAGALMTALWSYQLVDDVVAGTVVDSVLGERAVGTPIATAGAGIAFALVSGLAGTLTACNIAVFGALPTLIDPGRSRTARLIGALRPLGWLTLGTLAVSMTYGAVGVLLGPRLPQLSDEVLATGMPLRILQAVVVFGVIGTILLYLGFAALGVVPDPLRTVAKRWPPARMVVMGMLIGGFLIGRPFPMFRALFDYAVTTGNPLYGALTFGLQSLGNLGVVALLLLLMATLGGRMAGRAARRPELLSDVAGVALLVVGSFTVLYWCVRVPAIFGWGWYPVVPWSS